MAILTRFRGSDEDLERQSSTLSLDHSVFFHGGLSQAGWNLRRFLLALTSGGMVSASTVAATGQTMATFPRLKQTWL